MSEPIVSAALDRSVVRPVVVHVLDELGVGGLEHVALTLIEQTSERYAHHVICMRNRGSLAMRAQQLGVPVLALAKKAGQDWNAYLRLRAMLAGLGAQIVHTYNLGTLDVAVWARLAGVRRVLHAEHGRSSADPLGRNRKHRWLRRAVAPAISVFVPVSQDLERWLLEDIHVPARKVRLIRNGIDTDRFTPVDPRPTAGRRASTICIGTVGRLDPVKGFDTLVAAFAMLKESLPDRALQLTIVGEGSERAALQAQIDKAGLGDEITLAGNRDDIADILKTLDIYVCSSIAEGIALTMLEAMASALPIVATAVGGNPELIDDGVSGLLVPAASAPALAEALQTLVEDPERARAFGQAARARVLADFSVRAMTDHYCQLYDSLLSSEGTTVCVD